MSPCSKAKKRKAVTGRRLSFFDAGFKTEKVRDHIYGLEHFSPPPVLNYSKGHESLLACMKHGAHRHIAHVAAAGGLDQVVYFFVVYFGLAFLFAVLLAADPRGLIAYGNARDSNSFGDCFFLSVQAMSTIGFGAISPKSTYSNVVISLLSFVSVLYISFLTAVFIGNLLTPVADWTMSDCACLWHDKETNRTVLQVRMVFGPGKIYTNLRAEATVEAVADVGKSKTQTVTTKSLQFDNGKSLVRSTMWVLTHSVVESSPIYDACREVLHHDDESRVSQEGASSANEDPQAEEFHDYIRGQGFRNEELAHRVHRIEIRMQGTDPRLQAHTETVHIFGVSLVSVCQKHHASHVSRLCHALDSSPMKSRSAKNS